MTDIFTQIFFELKAELAEFQTSDRGVALLGGKTIFAHNAYLRSTQDFPCATIEEKSNTNASGELDFVEKRSHLMYEINVYDNSKNRIEICRIIAGIIDEYMARKMGFSRITAEPFPNLADSTVYRYLMRYEGYLDTETGNISRINN